MISTTTITNALTSPTLSNDITIIVKPFLNMIQDFAHLIVTNVPQIIRGFGEVFVGAFYNTLQANFILMKTQIKICQMGNVAGYCVNQVADYIVPMLALYAIKRLYDRYKTEIKNTLTYRDDIPIQQPGLVPNIPNQNALVPYQLNAAPMVIPRHIDVNIAAQQRDQFYEQWKAQATYDASVFYGTPDIAKDDLNRVLTHIKHSRIQAEYIPSTPLPVGSIIRISERKHFVVQQLVYLQDERPLSDRVVEFSSGLVYKLELHVASNDYIKSWFPQWFHNFFDRSCMCSLGLDRKHFFINHELLLKSRRFLLQGSDPTTILVEKDLSVNSTHLPLLQYGVYLNRDSAFVLRTMHSGNENFKYETFQ